MNYCKQCKKQLSKKQRSFCSRKCHFQGQTNKTIVDIRTCDYCKNDFEFHPKWKAEQNKKYCNKQCKDLHQKITYIGENNPCYGFTWTQEEREKHAISTATYWKKQENIEKHRETMRGIANRLGHWPGTDKQTRNKVRETCLLKFGVDHPWKNPVIRRKCDETSIKLYGKTTWEIAHDSTRKNETNIERKMSKLLIEMGVEFIHPYRLTERTLSREFDFFVPSINTLIEVDGDYFHANPLKFDCLDQTQYRSKINDDMKNNMAQKLSIRLLRFWESDIMQNSFSDILKEKLWPKNSE